MANENIRVSMKFDADVSQAKKQIANLNASLDKVMQTTSRNAVGNKLASDLKEATIAAAQLKAHITEAFNSSTGKLDLTRFNQSLKESGMSIAQYKAALAQAGPAGQQAFNQLAMSITTAEIPLIRINNRLAKLGTTLANTARWQISSSVLQGFTGAISQAYRYAQDLNESLNKIRIVTGYNIDQMDKFTVQATKAAKALNTTTVKYADASLIYFQQGLNDQEVQKRTNLTVQMANVTGQAVSQVSDQLTAVWNNFDNGTKSLDHYVDVMVALGAATASSSDEIAQGMEKFAAVAETVGLSYEYAASALATVTAETRQSADVVGTAFKTLFSRIQDLELGKTLDDGTTLGQYSEALAAVGINIKDANSEVKQMDTILNEMGAKWKTLTQAQQIALAQNVAGVRQYTQLVALMENWDTFQENLNTSLSSAGALQEQADIYAESWKAARDEVTASLEEIYNKLLEDEAFIDILNFIDKAVDGVSNLIDGLGGLQGVLITLSTVLLKVFSQQIASGLTNLHYSLKGLTQSGRQELIELQKETSRQMAANYGTKGASALEGKAVASMADSQMAYTDIADKLNEKQKMIAQNILEQQKGLAQAAIEEAKLAEEAEKRLNILKFHLKLSKEMKENPEQWKKFKETEQAAKATAYTNRLLEDVGVSQPHFESLQVGESSNVVRNGATKDIEELQNRLSALGISSNGLSEEIKELVSNVGEIEKKLKEYADAVNNAANALDPEGGMEELEQAKALKKLAGAEQELYDEIEKNRPILEQQNENWRDSIEAATASGAAFAEAAIKTSEATGAAKDLPKVMKDSTAVLRDTSQDIVDFASGLSSIAMGFSALKGALDVLNNEDMTFWEKLLTITTSLGMAIPALVNGWKSLTNVEWKNTAGKVLNAAATLGQAQAENTLQREKKESLKVNNKQNISDLIDTGKKKLKNVKNKWNEISLSKSKNFEADNGEYKVLKDGAVKGQKAGSTVTKDTALSAAGKTSLKGLAGSVATAATVAAVVLAAKAVYDEADQTYNRDEYAAQKAEKAAQSLADAYSEAANKYNQLTEASNSYFDGIKSLDELEKGTLEYQDAVSKTNEEALKLIDTYDELAGQYHTTAEGLIVFNEGALENIRLLEMQRKNAAAASSAVAKHDAQQARTKADTTKFLREDIKSNESTEITTEDKTTWSKAGAIGAGVGAATAALGGAKIGGLLGSVIPIPVVGQVVGAALGAVAGLLVGGIVSAVNENEATNKEKQAIETLSKAYNKMGNAALTKDNMQALLGDSDLVESLNKNSEELEKLLIEIKANTEARKAENINLAREQMSTIDRTFNDYDQSVQSAMATVAGLEKTRLEDEIDYNKGDYSKGGLFGRSFSTTATKKGKEQFEAWKNASDRKSIDDVDFKKDTIKYTYLDEEGKRQKAELTYEELSAWQEGQEISKQTEENYAKIRDTIFDIAQQKGGEGLVKLLGGQDINQLTLDEYNNLKSNITGFKDELAKLGKDTGEEYLSQFTESLKNWDEDTAFNNFSRKVKQETDAIFAKGSEEASVSTKALENYSKSLMKNSKALNGNGEELNQWQKTANKKIAAEMAVANAKFAKGIITLNGVMEDSVDVLSEWNEGSLETWEAVGKVQEALEQAFGVKVSADYVKNNLSEIQQLAQGDVSSLKELQEEAARDYVLNLDIADNAKNNLLAMLNQAIGLAEKEVDGIVVDATLDESSYIDQLNKMLEAGDITAEEVKNTFAAIGYAVDIKTKTVPSTTHSKYTIKDEKTGDIKEWSVDTTTTMEVPYIAGKNTKNEGKTITTASGEQVTVGYQDNGDGFTYTGGNTTKGSLVSHLNKDEAKSLKEKQKALEDDVDIYHEEKAILSDIERELNRINKLKDRSWGNARLKVMEKEIEVLKEEQKATEALAEAQRKDAQQRATDLAKNYGAQFNVDGQILNWEELRQQVNDTYLAEWKKAAGNEERQQELNDWRDKFIKDFEDYENILGEAKDNTEKAADQINEIFDRELEEVDYKLEIRIELNENDLKRLQKELKKLDDPIMDGVNALKNLSEQFKENEDNFKGYQEGIKDTLRKSFGDVVDDIDISSAEGLSKIMELVKEKGLDANSIEQLKKYRDGLEDTTDSMEELYGEAFERLNSAIQVVGEESDKAAEKINHFNSMLNSLKDAIDIVGAKNLGLSDKDLLGLSDAMVKGAKQSLAQAKTAYKLAQDNYKDIKAQYDNTEDGSEEKEKLKKTLDLAESEMRDAEKNLSSTFQNTLTTIAQDFETGFDIALKAFEKGIAGVYETLEEASKAYEQQAEIAERYLADYEKVYEFSKLNRTINKSINETNNIKGKQELLKLQKEIQDLQESGAEVSQYDLDVLQKRYDLRVAEIALEEAQQNKSIVRMKRDSEGNMAYVYTADSNEIAEKQQNYEDKLYEASDFNEKYISQQESALIKNKQDWQAAIAELKSKQGEMTPEEAEAAMQKIVDYYTERQNYILNELQKATDNNARLYAEDWIRYEGYIDDKKSKDLELRTQFADTAASIIFGYEDADDAQKKSKAASDALIPEIKQLYISFRNEVKGVFDSVGLDWKNFANKLPEYTKKILKEMGKVNDQFNSWAEAARTGVQGMIDVLNDENFHIMFSNGFVDYYNIAVGWVNDINELLSGIEAPNLDDVSNDLFEGLGLDNISGGLEGLKDYINEFKGGVGETKDYYGTYTIGGKTYITKKAYGSKAKAEDEAKEEAKNAVSSIIKEHQYNASVRNGSQKYANTLASDLLKTVSYGTQAYGEGYAESYDIKDSKKTISVSMNGTPIYFSDDTKIEDTGEILDGKRLIKVNNTGYYFSEEQLKRISQSLSKNSNFNLAFRSESGDSKFQDPPFEPEDKVASSEQRRDGGTNLVNIYSAELNPLSKKIKSFTATGNYVTGKSLEGAEIIEGPLEYKGLNYYGVKTNKGKVVWLNGHQLVSYDTGGYTGSWDSSGRLAMLHQKEIVLNATDTENFLAAINIVRDIARAIDLQAVAYQSTLGSLVASANVSMHPQTVQQDVVIHAEFPNATNHSEIEAAFDNLINRASQFANRKN